MLGLAVGSRSTGFCSFGALGARHSERQLVRPGTPTVLCGMVCSACTEQWLVRCETVASCLRFIQLVPSNEAVFGRRPKE